jgi:SEC-C motif domain protein
MDTILMPCPCSSGHSYGVCCQPSLVGQAIPPTAEILMRSRYTAFTLGDIDYLIATHHPTRRTPDQRHRLAETIQGITWMGLRVLHTQQGQPADRQGQVEFVAYYRQATLGQIHERSRFVKQKDRWFYLDGDRLPPLWPQRTDRCWCGSGKKYKTCHGR